MRKTNRNIKRVKFFKRLAVFFVAQAIIILLFVCIDKSQSDDLAESVDLKESTVVVDEVSYEYKFLAGSMFSFFSDSAEYHFPKYPIAGTNEYSMRDLYETVNAGDELTIQYVERPTGHTVIGAQKGDTVLRSVEPYDDFLREQHVLTIIALAVVEVIFAAVLIFFVWFYWDEVKLFPAKKSKKKERMAR